MCPLSHYPSLISFSKDLCRIDGAGGSDANVDGGISGSGWEWVGIEMGGVPLDTFVHPRRAVYILGSEDNGLSSMLRGACKHVVELPSVRTASFNVAVAGSLVMFDRLSKAESLCKRSVRDAKEASSAAPTKKRKKGAQSAMQQQHDPTNDNRQDS
jgi:hypothetical protein